MGLRLRIVFEEKLYHIGLDNDFFGFDPKSSSKRTQNRQMGLQQLLAFHSAYVLRSPRIVPNPMFFHICTSHDKVEFVN